MSNLPKKRWDIEIQNLMTLSQQLAKKEPQLVDYACNVFADQISTIDIYLAMNKDDQELCEILNAIREQLKIKGRAKWINGADILTNLGLFVGQTGRDRIGGSRNK